MDPNTIIEALRGTMDPALREAAERQLNEAHKSLNFVSTLLQITMSEQLDLPNGNIQRLHPETLGLLCGLNLTTCIHHIIKHDYPSRWTAIVDKIGFYLQSDNSACWLGILLCLYQLVKNYDSELGYMRARACWVLHYFCEVKFKSDQNLQTALELTRRCLIDDREMPIDAVESPQGTTS
ncbi:hypothetical protein H8959_002280 [Pygathrix nigripes]